MTCKMCRERGKNWDGHEPKCAFPDGAFFDPNNWNCATANAIRDICGEYGDTRSPGVDWRCHNERLDSSNQKYAMIEIDDAVEVEHDEDWRPLCLWVTWYKQRGRTDAMWLLSDDGQPRLPNEADCLEIIAKIPAAKDAA